MTPINFSFFFLSPNPRYISQASLLNIGTFKALLCRVLQALKQYVPHIIPIKLLRGIFSAHNVSSFDEYTFLLPTLGQYRGWSLPQLGVEKKCLQPSVAFAYLQCEIMNILMYCILCICHCGMLYYFANCTNTLPKTIETKKNPQTFLSLLLQDFHLVTSGFVHHRGD